MGWISQAYPNRKCVRRQGFHTIGSIPHTPFFGFRMNVQKRTAGTGVI